MPGHVAGPQLDDLLAQLVLAHELVVGRPVVVHHLVQMAHQLGRRPALHGVVADQEDVVDVDEVGQVEQVLHQPLHLRVLHRRDRLRRQPQAVGGQPHVHERVGKRRLEDGVALLLGVARRHGQPHAPPGVAHDQDVHRRQRTVPLAVGLDGPGRALPLLAGGLEREEVAVLVVVDDLLDAQRAAPGPSPPASRAAAC